MDLSLAEEIHLVEGFVLARIFAKKIQGKCIFLDALQVYKTFECTVARYIQGFERHSGWVEA